jgi:hypothetical protein
MEVLYESFNEQTTAACAAALTCWLGVQPSQHAAWTEKRPGLPASKKSNAQNIEG